MNSTRCFEPSVRSLISRYFPIPGPVEGRRSRTRHDSRRHGRDDRRPRTGRHGFRTTRADSVGVRRRPVRYRTNRLFNARDPIVGSHLYTSRPVFSPTASRPPWTTAPARRSTPFTDVDSPSRRIGRRLAESVDDANRRTGGERGEVNLPIPGIDALVSTTEIDH
ncbi:hypothetical protein EA472_21315 [Natrarchaeobius oligotrophus]|uniref:Uncharacterized protein n=1 Tax=Natrarchaeobius chitinivorans TaxID=1679083 RepID=A0A3N6M1U9_NATCH|nr:hypothetical protein EA472_21315 [Natrarchaeobius chitinivorans]